MEIDVGEKVRRDYAFFVVRPSGARIVRRAGDQHVARLQRLRRTEPVHRRHARCHAATDGGGLPLQAAGQGPARHGHGRARSAERRARRLRHAQPSVGLRRVGGLARLGAAVHRVGRTRRVRDRCVHERRSRRAPRGARRRELVSVGRPRRVLVDGNARHGRGIHRARRQRRVLLGQHVVVAGAHRGRRSRRDGRVQGLLQERPADGNRPRAGGDDVLVRRGRRSSREPHDRRLVHPRRLSPHRSQRDRRPRRLHRAPRRPLDLRRHRARLRRRARRRRDHRRLRVRRVRVHLPRRAAVPDRRGRHAADLRDPRHVPDAALHARDRASSAQAGRAERVGVHRVTRVRDA